MAFDNLGAFVQAGKQAGEASQSPAGYAAQNTMDLFKQQQQLQMQAGLQGALQENEQQILNKYEPARKGLEKKQELQATGEFMGNMFNKLGLSDNNGSGDASTSNDASKPIQNGPPTANPNPTQSVGPHGMPKQGLLPSSGVSEFDLGGMKVQNIKFQNLKAAADAEIKHTQAGALGAQDLVKDMDQAHVLFDKAMANGSLQNNSNADNQSIGGIPGDPTGVTNYLSKQWQGASKSWGAASGTNADALAYKNFIHELGFKYGKKDVGESSRVPIQMMGNNELQFPALKSNPREADTIWGAAYKNVNNIFDTHNNTVRKWYGDNNSALEINPQSPYLEKYISEIQTNPIQSAAAAQSNSANPQQESPLQTKVSKRGYKYSIVT